MKRVIKASANAETYKYDGNPFPFQHGMRRFMARINADNNLIRNGSITQIRPYDDAEYTWAKIEGPVVKFIRDGKVLDKMTIHDYDEDDYESGFDEYIGDVLDTIAVELLDFDRDVKPIIIHN